MQHIKSIFSQVYLFPVDDLIDGNKVQNIILIALKSDQSPSFNSTNTNFQEYLQHLWKNKVDTDVPILTDDFAPVNYYINKLIIKIKVL